MLEITQEHLIKFRKIKEQYFNPEYTNVPKKGNWKSLSNNDIWLRIITQIIVPGKAEPANRFNSNIELKESVSFERVLQINDDDKIKKIINDTLRTVGTRWVSKDILKCRKTNALLYNFKVLKDVSNGPKGLFVKLENIERTSGDKQKINYLIKHLKFMGSKNARDFLMEVGMIRNAVAFDIRIRDIFQQIGIELPDKFESKPMIYDEIEHEVLTKICEPLELEGVEFDRMLFQNYSKIVKHGIAKSKYRYNTEDQKEERHIPASPNSIINEITHEEYSLDYYLNQTSEGVAKIFKEIQENNRNLHCTEEDRGHPIGISYRTMDKNSKSLARFEFQRKAIRLILLFSNYNDPEKLVINISSYGGTHKGKVKIYENSNADYIADLIKQTYQRSNELGNY